MFLELLQVALGNRDRLTHTLSEEEWLVVLKECKRQALLGIAYYGLNRLPKEQWPTMEVVWRWTKVAARIMEINAFMDERCKEVTGRLREDGVACRVFKGQSLAQYYGELAPYRSSGDIDVIAVKNYGKLEVRRKFLTEYVRKSLGGDTVSYHHIDVVMFPWREEHRWNPHVEVHFTPTYLANPYRNGRLQKWVDGLVNGDSSTSFMASTNKKDNSANYPNLTDAETDVVFILGHIFRHYIEEGVGMRQMMDLYMVLQKVAHRKSVMRRLESFGYGRFASAVMWALWRIFEANGNEYEYENFFNWRLRWEWMLCKPNKKLGQKLLEQVMHGGNFGKADDRIKKLNKGRNAFVRFCKRETFYMRNVIDYPGEVLWLPMLQWRRWKLRKD